MLSAGKMLESRVLVRANNGLDVRATFVDGWLFLI
jgi:hypothetical protein